MRKFHFNRHVKGFQKRLRHRLDANFKSKLKTFAKIAFVLLLGSIWVLTDRQKTARRSEGQLRVPSDEKLARFLKQRLDGFSLEIFSAPKPFKGENKLDNERAIRSWQSLEPKPRITLLGDETGYAKAAAEFGLRRLQVDQNFLGVPLFNSIFHQANTSKAMITVIVNGDILLFDDFIQTLRKVASRFEHFMAIGARFDIDDIPGSALTASSDPLHSLRQYVHSEGTLHTNGGMDFWAWNVNGPPIFDTVMPPFVFGRGKYDNWLTHETIRAGRRAVVDVSESALAVHYRHGYHLVEGNSSVSGELFWSTGKKVKFELFLNIYHSMSVGTYSNQMGNVLYAPWKLTICAERSGLCLLQRKRPALCPCESSSFFAHTQTDPVYKRGAILCGIVSRDRKKAFKIPVRTPRNSSKPVAFGLPLTMESVTERVVLNNTIILSVMNYGHRGLLMNWVCNMRRLGITNFVIAALDPDMYKYAYTRGAPVYYEYKTFDGLVGTAFRAMKQAMLSDAPYGSDALRQLTKTKSRVVVSLLRHGYNVLLSECDIVWFKNPLHHMWAQNGDLVIQGEFSGEDDKNLTRLNSGFYLARSNVATIRAIQNVIRYCRIVMLFSEQRCYNDILCRTEQGQVRGRDTCRHNSAIVKVLKPHQFPSATSKGPWEMPPKRLRRKFPDMFIIHNNGAKTVEEKWTRLSRHGFIFYDRQQGVCKYDPHFE